MGELYTNNDRRTAFCGEFRKEHIGQRVNVVGWAQRQRDLGSLIFIDLRDRTGIVQLAFDDQTEKSIHDMAFKVRAEFVIAAKGVVRMRSSINPNIPSGV